MSMKYYLRLSLLLGSFRATGVVHRTCVLLESNAGSQLLKEGRDQPQAEAQTHLLLFQVLLQHQIGQSYLEQDDGLGQ